MNLMLDTLIKVAEMFNDQISLKRCQLGGLILFSICCQTIELYVYARQWPDYQFGSTDIKFKKQRDKKIVQKQKSFSQFCKFEQ
jgi:hypothetical protein